MKALWHRICGYESFRFRYKLTGGYSTRRTYKEALVFAKLIGHAKVEFLPQNIYGVDS